MYSYISQISNKTNQSLNNLSRDIYNTNTLINQTNKGLTLNLINSLERDFNNTQIRHQENHNNIKTAIANTQHNLDTQLEKCKADSNLTTLNTTNTIRESLHDSSYSVIKTVQDEKRVLNKEIQNLIAEIYEDAESEKKETREQNGQTRYNNNKNFENVKYDIKKNGKQLQLNEQLNFTQVNKQIINNETQQTLANRDIQLLTLANKYEQQKFASANANTAKLDTLSSTERLAHQIQDSDLEALKHKEMLAQQILQKELDIIQSENRIISSMKKKTCELKEQIDMRAKRTQRLLKHNDIERIKDEILTSEIEMTERPRKHVTHKCN
jgi:hypothetical protein